MASRNNIRHLLNDPGITEARKLVDSFAERGIIVFTNPGYGVMLVNQSLDSRQPLPTSADMAIVDSLREEIETMYALQALAKHYQAVKTASESLSRICDVSKTS